MLSRFDVLSQSIKVHRKVRILYGKSGEDNEEALLSPYKIYVYCKENYVAGYCEPEGEIRLFRLDDLRDAVPTEQSYDLTPLLIRAEIFPYLTEEMNSAIIRFDIPSYAQMLDIRAVELVPGTFRVEYMDKDLLIAKLLGCPTGFEILTPRWLHNLTYNRLRRKLGIV
jgi:predicted DNA-binding transcriptional regulator YafY